METLWNSVAGIDGSGLGGLALGMLSPETDAAEDGHCEVF